MDIVIYPHSAGMQILRSARELGGQIPYSEDPAPMPHGPR